VNNSKKKKVLFKEKSFHGEGQSFGEGRKLRSGGTAREGLGGKKGLLRGKQARGGLKKKKRKAPFGEEIFWNCTSGGKKKNQKDLGGGKCMIRAPERGAS